jgi:ferredoxin
VKVVVEYESCEANGICAGIAPEVFDLDEGDQLNVVAQPGPDTIDRVRQAVQSCPKVALKLTEDTEDTEDTEEER